jgi:hypothetical protein
MSLRPTRNIIRVFILLLTFESVNATSCDADNVDAKQTSIHSKHLRSLSSLFSALLSEKREKEERTQEERAKFPGIQLADFGKVAIILPGADTPVFLLPANEPKVHYQPSLFKLFCVYLI